MLCGADSAFRPLGPPHRGVPESQGPHIRGLVDVAQVHQHGGAHQAADALQVQGAKLVPFVDDHQNVGALDVAEVFQPLPPSMPAGLAGVCLAMALAAMATGGF